MNTKQKLAYIAIGGVLVATGMIISPLNAQKDKFGAIECTRLTVVDDDGTPRVMLMADISFFTDYVQSGEEVKVVIYASDSGGHVVVQGRDNEDGGVQLLSGYGSCPASVQVWEKNGTVSVDITTDEFGGLVHIRNNEGHSVGTFPVRRRLD